VVSERVPRIPLDPGTLGVRTKTVSSAKDGESTRRVDVVKKKRGEIEDRRFGVNKAIPAKAFITMH